MNVLNGQTETFETMAVDVELESLDGSVSKQFVAQTHAEKHRDEFPMAAETVLKSTYMDDSMDSVVDKSQGIKLYEELNQLWFKAGIQAHKWLSNSTKVLERIPAESGALEAHIASDGLPMVNNTWCHEEDVRRRRFHVQRQPSGKRLSA